MCTPEACSCGVRPQVRFPHLALQGDHRDRFRLARPCRADDRPSTSSQLFLCRRPKSTDPRNDIRAPLYGNGGMYRPIDFHACLDDLFHLRWRLNFGLKHGEQNSSISMTRSPKSDGKMKCRSEFFSSCRRCRNRSWATGSGTPPGSPVANFRQIDGTIIACIDSIKRSTGARRTGLQSGMAAAVRMLPHSVLRVYSADQAHYCRVRQGNSRRCRLARLSLSHPTHVHHHLTPAAGS